MRARHTSPSHLSMFVGSPLSPLPETKQSPVQTDLMSKRPSASLRGDGHPEASLIDSDRFLSWTKLASAERDVAGHPVLRDAPP